MNLYREKKRSDELKKTHNQVVVFEGEVERKGEELVVATE